MRRERLEDKIDSIKSDIYTLEEIQIENGDVIDFQERKFPKIIDRIKQTIEEIDDLLLDDTSANNKKILGLFKAKRNDEFLDRIDNKLAKINEEVIKLNKCKKCECATCINQVCEDSCLSCELSGLITSCNKDEMFRVQRVDDWTMSVFDNNNNQDVVLEIRNLIERLDDNVVYAYIRNRADNSNYLQIYNKDSLRDSEDDEIFIEISSEDEFDEIDRIVNKYIG